MSAVAENPPHRILIVRPSALGDVARTVPALVTLRRAYPKAQIHWLVAELFGDVVRHHPMLDKVIPFPRHKLRRLGLSPAATRRGLDFARTLRQGKYDTVFDLQGLLRSGIITAATRAKKRIGFANARELGWLGYNIRYAVPRRQHAVDRMLGLLGAHQLNLHHDMQLYLGSEDQQWLNQFCEQHHTAPDQLICLAPTARWLSKCWPIDRYTAIAKKIIEHTSTDTRLIILASPSESDLIKPLLKALPKDRTLAPATTVGQMMALLSQTRLLVCNDSAPLHIAVGFNRPIVTLFGPTDPTRVGPYRRLDTVIQPQTLNNLRRSYRKHTDQSLISEITLDQVWQAVQKHLT